MKRAALCLLAAGLAAGSGLSSTPARGASSTAPTRAADTAGGCVRVARPAPKPAGVRHAPSARLRSGRTYTAVVTTNCGSFSIRLDPKSSPKTAASFVALARARFFDGTIFHRIVRGFVIQGGDPTQSGSGGPGYTVVDKPPAGTRYVRGVVAMAKTPDAPAGSSGSQFFVVTGADVGLPPDYAVLGRVVAGLPVVLRIGRLGNAQELPTRVVEIEHVAIRTS